MKWAVITAKRWLYSAKLAPWQKKILKDIQSRMSVEAKTIWLLSSGTQSLNELKAIELSHEAILTSAKAVNKHLKVTAKDRWLLTLPVYHIGGLSILARAHLSKSKVFALDKWSAGKFVSVVTRHNISLVSLVPTQVFDLVNENLSAPKSLRAIVVGGGSLDQVTYTRARALGWPVLPSYGLTECCSQVATASLSSLKESGYPGLEILSHVEVELREGRIFLKSKSLAKSVAIGRQNGAFTREDPKRSEWLATEDLAEKNGKYLKILGRRDDVVKILGVLVPVNQVEHDVREFFRARKLAGDLTVLAVRGGREENRLVLVTDTKASLKEWQRTIVDFNSGTPGPQRIKQLCWTSEIPRGDLGKVKKAALAARIGL